MLQTHYIISGKRFLKLTYTEHYSTSLNSIVFSRSFNYFHVIRFLRCFIGFQICWNCNFVSLTNYFVDFSNQRIEYFILETTRSPSDLGVCKSNFNPLFNRLHFWLLNVCEQWFSTMSMTFMLAYSLQISLTFLIFSREKNVLLLTCISIEINMFNWKSHQSWYSK